MGVVKAIVRLFSYVYHTLLALFLIAVSGLSLATGQSLHLDMLPWTGSTLTWTLLLASIVGLVTVLLAVSGALRFPFFLWSLIVAGFLIRGFLFTGYRFEPGSGGVKTAVYLIVGSLIALLGALWQMMQRSERRY